MHSAGERIRAALRTRRSFRFGLGVLLFVYAAAVYAPLIANDRPYYLNAIDYGEYERARSLLPTVMRNFADAEGDARTAEGEAARLRLQSLARYSEPAIRSELEGYEDELDAIIATGLDADTARGRALELMLRVTLRMDTLVPQRAGLTVNRAALVADASYPLFESLKPLDVFFMVLFALLASWRLWNRVFERWMPNVLPARWKLAGVVLDSAVIAILWSGFIGAGGTPFATASYKSALTRGDLVAESVYFPPIAMGYAETHLAEGLRPPTWLSSSELDPRGRYVNRQDPSQLVVDSPVEVRAGEPDLNSPWRHVAGTDSSGRDVLVRLLWGGRVSLSIGLISAALLTLIGVFLGAIAGFFGGRVDFVVLRIVEVLQSIPALFLILLAMAFTDPAVVPPIIAIVVVIAVFRWTGTARLVRGEMLRLRQAEFIQAAEALGYSRWRTLWAHALPNAMGPILVSAAFAVGMGILMESAVSFLGLGIQEPDASWGALVGESRQAGHWWLHVFPGVAICLTVLSYNLVGDAIRDALDPRVE